MTSFNLTVLITGFLICIGLCILLVKVISTWESLDRILQKLLVSTLPVPLLLIAAWILNGVLGSPWELWNGARLAPTIALVHGYKLYYGLDSGPVLGTVYPPFNYLAYLPAAIASSPTIAIFIGISIASSFYFIPVLWLLLGEYLDTLRKKGIAIAIFVGFWVAVWIIYEISGGKLGNIFISLACFCIPILWFNSKLLIEKFWSVIIGLWGLVFFCLVSTYDTSLSSIPMRIHADAPALGLSALAGAFLYFRKDKNNLRDLAISAVFAILALWTKQQALPLIFGLSTYVYLADGKKCFLRYVTCLAVSLVSISVILLLIFDSSATILNAFTLPSKLPLTGEPWDVLMNGFREILTFAILPIAIIALISPNLVPTIRENQIVSWLSHNRWFMFVIVALFMIPSSLLARTRIGGNFNNLSFTIYFLVIAATLALTQTSITTELQRSTQTTLLVLSVCLLSLHIPLTIATFNTLPNQHGIVPTNPQEYLFKYSQANPDKAFFPWAPLASIIGEGKLYHFDYGILDRSFQGYEISKEQFLSGIPSNLKFVVYPAAIPSHVGEVEQSGTMKAIRKYIPDVSQQPVPSTDINLPGWNVYARP